MKDSSTMQSCVLRFVVPVINLIVFAVFTVLYISKSSAYRWILDKFILVPAPRPFVDWEYVYAAIRCTKEGVDVFQSFPCYTVFEMPPFAYSPLWLYGTFIPDDSFWGNVVAFCLGALFLLSLALLPHPRNLIDFAVTLLATLSSAIALGIERGNADLLMFLMIITGASLGILRLPFRLIGYGLFALAGLLKFYPFAALITAVRERFIVFLFVSSCTVSLLALLVYADYDDMVLMFQNLPVPDYFRLQFGAADLPAGVGQIAQSILSENLLSKASTANMVGNLIYRGLLPLLTIGAIAIAIRKSAGWGLLEAMPSMPRSQAGFLFVGASIICGCFFAGSNHPYRGMYLLLALPGLFVLSHDLPNRRARTIFRLTSFAVVYVQWELFIEWCINHRLSRLPHHDAVAAYAQWFCNELAWWWIVTVLLSIVVTFVLGSEQWRLLSRLLRLPRDRFAGRAPISGIR